MSFTYRVRDPLGNTHAGTLEAASLDEAAQQLRREGFDVVELEEDGDFTLLKRRVSKSEIIYTTSQLSIMVDTGITLSAALAGIVDQEENPTLRKILIDLRESVESGDDFSTALARHPKLFDRTYVSLVKASEATGTMGEMLERIAGYLRKEVETRSKIRAAMAYPAVMMVMAVGVTIFLLTYILPQFKPLFEARGDLLPRSTKIMMSASTFLLAYWYVWVMMVVLAVAGFVLGKRTARGRRTWDWVKISLPLVGPTYRKVIISRSLRTLATMIAAGVSIVDSIRLSAEVAGNCHYERLWMEVLERVTAGKRIHEALSGNPLFPSVLVQMITAGEETGKLDYVLERVSSYYDQEVDASLKTTTSLIEPIMISIMGVVVGTIGLSLLLPIFSLSKPQ